MYNFDDLGKKISEIDERIDALIAKTGLSYSEFAVLYTLAKDGRSTQKGCEAADPIVRTSDELGERVFARLGEKNTEKLFSLLTRFCEICDKEIENTPGIQTKI